MKIELNKVYFMDCLKGLRGIKDNSIDLILTDPPYNISRKREFSRKGKNVNLNFGDWDSLEDEDYYKWMKEVWTECRRVLKEYGQLITFAPRNWEFEAVLGSVFEIKRMMIWHKTNPTPQFMKISYLTSFEKILWAAKDNEHPSKFTFNFGNQNEMHDFFESSICMGVRRTSHPTQKSFEVVEKLLKTHSNRGDVVLDPFVGSGTTVDVCIVNGREFIAFENDKDSLKIMKEERWGRRARDLIVEDMKKGVN